MTKKSSSFACRDCGDTFARWAGRCPSCGAMNTIAEITAADARLAAKSAGQARAAAGLATESASAGSGTPIERMKTGSGELDRVLGGGLPVASAVLIGGEPGIGKSTLLAQVAGAVAAGQRVLYVTAEESTEQVRERLRRLGVARDSLDLAATSDGEAIAGALTSGTYRLVVVDSIQLVAVAGIDGEPGGVSQIRAAAAALVEAAKRGGTAVILVGHVTKDGTLAGPRLLEHLVDVVLSFEGDRYGDVRTLRAVKNRHGSTNEVALFRMASTGLVEVADPTGMFIADRDPGVPGSCVVPIMEGNRCLLVEVQALVNPTELVNPARKVSGCDSNRVAMVLAVLTRRLRLPLGTCDVFVNVTGGARIAEPAADLAVGLALASAWREVPIPADLVALGEVGLGGELRPAGRYELRAAEARRLGFQRLIGPGAGSGRGRLVCSRLADAVEAALG
ncbi:DNA repair protein RadA [Planctomycetota bacterium]|nr:DNA repair protein RadA [Planctomycetota bacterium]